MTEEVPRLNTSSDTQLQEAERYIADEQQTQANRQLLQPLEDPRSPQGNTSPRPQVTINPQPNAEPPIPFELHTQQETNTPIGPVGDTRDGGVSNTSVPMPGYFEDARAPMSDHNNAGKHGDTVGMDGHDYAGDMDEDGGTVDLSDDGTVDSSHKEVEVCTSSKPKQSIGLSMIGIFHGR